MGPNLQFSGDLVILTEESLMENCIFYAVTCLISNLKNVAQHNQNKIMFLYRAYSDLTFNQIWRDKWQQNLAQDSLISHQLM